MDESKLMSALVNLLSEAHECFARDPRVHLAIVMHVDGLDEGILVTAAGDHPAAVKGWLDRIVESDERHAYLLDGNGTPVPQERN